MSPIGNNLEPLKGCFLAARRLKHAETECENCGGTGEVITQNPGFTDDDVYLGVRGAATPKPCSECIDGSLPCDHCGTETVEYEVKDHGNPEKVCAGCAKKHHLDQIDPIDPVADLAEWRAFRERVARVVSHGTESAPQPMGTGSRGAEAGTTKFPRSCPKGGAA